MINITCICVLLRTGRRGRVTTVSATFAGDGEASHETFTIRATETGEFAVTVNALDAGGVTLAEADTTAAEDGANGGSGLADESAGWELLPSRLLIALALPTAAVVGRGH